jgi:hypothetical protein
MIPCELLVRLENYAHTDRVKSDRFTEGEEL